MLTIDEKIDFLKHCYRIYSNIDRRDDQPGFCRQCERFFGDEYDLEMVFPEFYIFIFQNVLTSHMGRKLIAAYDLIGYAHRAKLAAQYLREEFQIKV